MDIIKWKRVFRNLYIWQQWKHIWKAESLLVLQVHCLCFLGAPHCLRCARQFWDSVYFDCAAAYCTVEQLGQLETRLKTWRAVLCSPFGEGSPYFLGKGRPFSEKAKMSRSLQRRNPRNFGLLEKSTHVVKSRWCGSRSKLKDGNILSPSGSFILRKKNRRR